MDSGFSGYDHAKGQSARLLAGICLPADLVGACQILDDLIPAGRLEGDMESGVLGTRYWLLVAGYLLLVAGYSLLGTC